MAMKENADNSLGTSDGSTSVRSIVRKKLPVIGTLADLQQLQTKYGGTIGP